LDWTSEASPSTPPCRGSMTGRANVTRAVKRGGINQTHETLEGIGLLRDMVLHHSPVSTGCPNASGTSCKRQSNERHVKGMKPPTWLKKTANMPLIWLRSFRRPDFGGSGPASPRSMKDKSLNTKKSRDRGKMSAENPEGLALIFVGAHGVLTRRDRADFP